MCSVSVIQQYMHDRTTPNQWTRPMFDEYKEIIRRLDKLDGALGQPDCEDPAKAAWMREVEARLAKLEAA
jgi:hypothetical protein